MRVGVNGLKLGWIDGGVRVADGDIGVKKGSMECLSNLWGVRYKLVIKANGRLGHAP